MLLQLKYIKQELNDYAANYKSEVLHPNKHLMLAIAAPLKILTRHLQDHHNNPSKYLNINLDIKYEATLKPQRFRMSKNHMSDDVPPPTLGGSCTIIPPSDVCITDKMKIHPYIFTPSTACFTTNTAKQDKTPSLSAIPILKVGQYAIHIDSNATHVPVNITKVMICSISGDLMYLIEGKLNQYQQEKFDFLCGNSDPNIFLINITIRPLHTNTKPQTPATTIRC